MEKESDLEVICSLADKMFTPSDGVSVCRLSDPRGQFRFIYLPYPYWSDKFNIPSILRGEDDLFILLDDCLAFIRNSFDLDDGSPIDLASYYLVFGGDFSLSHAMGKTVLCVSCASLQSLLQGDC